MKIRKALQSDIKALCSILNEIIATGGTTGFEVKLSESEFNELFISGENCTNCLIAEKDGQVLGFQSLSRHPDLQDNWVDIATFAQLNPKVRGVGTALFKATYKFAITQKLTAINATIRADNQAGLNYYDKMGFSDYVVEKSVPLKDGTPVDRISKKLIVDLGKL